MKAERPPWDLRPILLGLWSNGRYAAVSAMITDGFVHRQTGHGKAEARREAASTAVPCLASKSHLKNQKDITHMHTSKSQRVWTSILLGVALAVMGCAKESPPAPPSTMPASPTAATPPLPSGTLGAALVSATARVKA